MKRRYWAVMVTGVSGEWWIHRDDVTDVYADPDVFLTREEARLAKKSNENNIALDSTDSLRVVELAIIRSPGN